MDNARANSYIWMRCSVQYFQKQKGGGAFIASLSQNYLIAHLKKVIYISDINREVLSILFMVFITAF